MVSLCIFGVLQVWYCLIGSLVILHGHVTHKIAANASYMAFIYTYISHACSYMVLIYSDVSHTCLCIACMLHLSSMTWLHVTHSAMCNIVWFRWDNPTRRPDGVPGIVEQP